jgi:hypothetical protein
MKLIWIGVPYDLTNIRWSQEYLIDDLLKLNKSDVLWLNTEFNENELDINFNNFFVVYSCDEHKIKDNIFNFIKKLNNQNKTFYLIHISNEQLRHDTSYYKLAKRVFRCYLDHRLKKESNMETIPIGYQSGYKYDGNMVKLKDKKYSCSFIGHPKNERFKMIEVMNKIDNNFIHETKQWDCPTKITQKKCLEIMSQSIIVPIPKGNIHFETHRFYEALEAKTIPVIRLYNSYNYYEDLLGVNPIPFVEDWGDLPKIMNYLNNEIIYDSLCITINDWYLSIKNNLSKNLISYLS